MDNVYKQTPTVMDSCVETLPTDCLDGFLSSPEDVRESQDSRAVCWGRMFPLDASCIAFGNDLMSDSYSFSFAVIHVSNWLDPICRVKEILHFIHQGVHHHICCLFSKFY